MASFSTLNELIESCLSCTDCDLAKHRTQVVPGEGDAHAQVMFIGEGPGYHEDQEGRPFVGQAGKLLDELIGSIGMKRSDVYIANVVKCRPPGNRDPLPSETKACAKWLEGQIALIGPKVIVTLGRHSMARFLPGQTISRAHGVARKVGELVVLPVHHPAAALYQQSLRKTLEADFQKIPAVLQNTQEVEQAVKKEEPKPEQLNLF